METKKLLFMLDRGMKCHSHSPISLHPSTSQFTNLSTVNCDTHVMEAVQKIGDYPFDITYMCYDESRYEEFLNVKHDEMKENFRNLFARVELDVNCMPEIDIIASPAKHCRQKCRFAIRKKKDLGISGEHGDELVHAMWDEGKPAVLVEAFPISSIQIYNVMPVLLEKIQSSSDYECICCGLASVHYLSTLSGALTITMNYDLSNKNSFEDEVNGSKCIWRIAAERLHSELIAAVISNVQSISIIGRTKGVKVVIGADFVNEILHLADGRSLHYKQVEEGFSNPNSFVNQRALDWLCSVAQQATTTSGCSPHSEETSSTSSTSTGCGSVDLLEMYCGNGNHTVALAAYFNRVMGVEINPALCAAATENFALNNITNAKVIVCDSSRFATTILRTKKYILYAPVNAVQEYHSLDTTGLGHTPVAGAGAGAGAEAGELIGLQEDQEQQQCVYGNKSTAQIRAAKNAERMKNKQQYTHHRIQKNSGSGGGGGAVLKVAEYEFNFGAVLVDPPRCGLDSLTLSLVGSYDHIIYISCCPESLMRDLSRLLKTHRLCRIALFDQFAYTPHIETGVWLQIIKHNK